MRVEELKREVRSLYGCISVEELYQNRALSRIIEEIEKILLAL